MNKQAKMVGFVVEFREIIGDRKVKKLIGDRKVKKLIGDIVGCANEMKWCDSFLGE